MNELLSQRTAASHNTFFALYVELCMKQNDQSQAAHLNAWVCLGNFVITIDAGELHELDPDCHILLTIISVDTWICHAFLIVCGVVLHCESKGSSLWRSYSWKVHNNYINYLLSWCSNVGHTTFSALHDELSMRQNGKSQAAHFNAYVCLGNFVTTICAGELYELNPDFHLRLTIISGWLPIQVNSWIRCAFLTVCVYVLRCQSSGSSLCVNSRVKRNLRLVN